MVTIDVNKTVCEKLLQMRMDGAGCRRNRVSLHPQNYFLDNSHPPEIPLLPKQPQYVYLNTAWEKKREPGHIRRVSANIFRVG